MSELYELYLELHEADLFCEECFLPDCSGCGMKYDKDRIRDEISEEIRKFINLTLSD